METSVEVERTLLFRLPSTPNQRKGIIGEGATLSLCAVSVVPDEKNPRLGRPGKSSRGGSVELNVMIPGPKGFGMPRIPTDETALATVETRNVRRMNSSKISIARETTKTVRKEINENFAIEGR